MGLFDSLKAMASDKNVRDEPYYEAVAHELAAGSIRPGLWAKALAQAEYDEPRAKALYIRLRVSALKSEIKELALDEQRQAQSHRRMLIHEQQSLESDALPAYQRGDYARAIKGFSALAEKGQSWAQCYLGIMYENGHGVTQDIDAAVAWYKKAADQNDRNAQYNLGRLCLHRFNRYDEASKWFALSARNGHPAAEGSGILATELAQAQRRLLGNCLSSEIRRK